MPHLKSSRILILADGVFIRWTPEQIEHIVVDIWFLFVANQMCENPIELL